MRLAKLSLFIIALLVLFFSQSSLVYSKTINKKTINRIAVTPTPLPQPSPTPVNSYVLFWPITAGRVMGDPLYTVKSFKENIRGMFIFGGQNKALYNLTLSEKRLVEAEYLYTVKNDYINAKKSLEASKDRLNTAVETFKNNEKTGTTDQLKINLIKSVKNQQSLVFQLISKVPQDQKSTLEEHQNFLASELTKLQ